MSKKHLLTGLHVVLSYKPTNVASSCAAAASVGAKCPTSAIYASDAMVKASADLFVQRGVTLALDEQAYLDAFKSLTILRTSRDQAMVALARSGSVLRSVLAGAAKSVTDVESLGMEVLVVQPPEPLSKVLLVTLKAGKAKNTIDLHARRLKGLTEYRTQLSVDPMTPTSFTDLVGTHAKRTVVGLVAGARYWFRVCAIRADEMGEWSEPVSIVVGG